MWKTDLTEIANKVATQRIRWTKRLVLQKRYWKIKLGG